MADYDTFTSGMNATKMAELAELIEQGTALMGVEESNALFGVWYDDARRTMYADVLGLAIIAKLGIGPAKKHFDAKKQSSRLWSANDETLLLEAFGAPLGIDDVRFLGYLLHLHSSTTAEHIVLQLKSGKLG